ncbi:hypothetical protein, partial [Undibacterium luofuense]|uniref:hypothetical protein n=1 Tax=Undibacterium luofuense TaxID=2828733 RepID=UPI0030EB408A
STPGTATTATTTPRADPAFSPAKHARLSQKDSGLFHVRLRMALQSPETSRNGSNAAFRIAIRLSSAESPGLRERLMTMFAQCAVRRWCL